MPEPPRTLARHWLRALVRLHQRRAPGQPVPLAALWLQARWLAAQGLPPPGPFRTVSDRFGPPGA